MESATTFRTALGLNGFGWAHVISDLPYDFDAILQHAASLGFDGIELFGLPDEYPATTADQVALRKRIGDRGLKVASIQSLPGGLGNDLWEHPDPFAGAEAGKRVLDDFLAVLGTSQ